jgi:hypothetical protein
MVVTQGLRRDGPIASDIRLKVKEGRYRPCFRLTRDDTVDADIVDASGTVIRTLASGERLEGDDTPHCFDWDGLTDDGQLVPPGKYRLRLALVEADRVATSGERLRVPLGGSRS